MADLLSVQEVAAELQLDPETIRVHCRQGTLPAVKVGKGWRVEREVLDRWLEESTRDLTRRTIGAKRLFSQILKMDADEMKLAFELISAACNLNHIQQHEEDNSDEVS